MSRDERLARRAARGDSGAFAEIFERYHQALYRFCLAMVGNPQDAQDALQSTMVKALRALPGERREIKLKPWLYRVARNESIEMLRRRREGVELEPEQEGEAGLAERAETRERLRVLLADLERLPERQRAALVMRELSGLGFAEIGAAFGSSAAVARQTLYEARLGLRKLEEGREMRCEEVMRELSDADGRVARRRQIRAHLDSCPDCRAFRDEIAARRENLTALAPLPLAASAGLLSSVLGAKAGSGSAVGGGLAGSAGAGAGAGKAVAAATVVKSALAVAAVAAVGVTAADRAHVIHLPLGGGSGAGAAQESAAHGSAAGGTAGEDTGAGSGAAESGHAPESAGTDAGGGGTRSGSTPGGAGGGSPGASSTSRSEAGEAPPGGGYGRSASERHGRPEGTPHAAEHSQSTAASQKSPHAESPPPSSSGNPPPSPPSGQTPPERPASPAAPASPPAPPASTAPTPPADSGPPSENPSGERAGAATGAERAATGAG